MRKVLMAALAALLLAAPAAAQQAKLSAEEKAKIKADVTVTVEAYFRLVFEGDGKAVVDKTFGPLAFGFGANGVAVTDPARQAEGLTAAGKRVRGEGYTKAFSRPVAVCILTPNSVIAGGNLYRNKADGSEHLISSESFLLARVKDGWKIVSIFLHEGPDQFPTCAS